MKLTTSKTSANPLPSRALMGSMAIVGSISVLSASVSLCSAASAGVLYQADYYSGTINTISATGAVKLFATLPSTNGPIGLAFDKDGYLYASDYNADSINKISPDGKTVTVFATGLNRPYGIAFDKDGTLLEADKLSNKINRISADGATVTPFVTTGLNAPAWLTFDKDGTLYESDHGSYPNSDGKINKISSTGSVIPFATTGLLGPFAMAFDKNGTLFVTDEDAGAVKKIDTDGNVTVFADNFTTPFGIAFDDSNNMFVTDYDPAVNSIVKISSTGVRTDNFVTGLNRPFGLIFGPDVPLSSTAVPEPFTIVGTLIGGTAALRMRKKLKDSNKA